MTEIIGGLKPIIEALRARGRTFEHIYLARGRSDKSLAELISLARNSGVRVERVERERLDRLYGRGNHQGVVARVGEYRYCDLEDILEKTGGEKALILVLDGIEDPMNLGSLLRSAEAAGVDGVVIPRERAAPVSPAAVKASAGAAEHVAVARVVNLNRSLDLLKQNGFWIIGTEAGAQESLWQQEMGLKVGLVIGSEGQGLRRLVREKCDRLVSIPLAGQVSSLNAAVAGALALFEYVRQTRESQRLKTTGRIDFPGS